MDKDSKDCRTMLKSEAKEHAELWRDKSFRKAVKKEERKGTGERRSMGKR